MFISPHLDDIALSCAGVLCDHRARGEAAVVINVFAGPPAADLPLRALHRDLVRNADVTIDMLRELHARRLAEDESAMKMLDAEVVHLAFADAALRPETERWANVWSEPGTTAPDITPALLDAWRAGGTPTIYAPLGVGGHVDHRLCFAAARALAHAGADVWHYEDHPYSTRPGRLDARLAELGDNWRSRTVDVSAHVDRRRAAVECYESQLRGMPMPITQTERLWCSP